ncbi:WD40 repeat-like protein [Auricularia subglabra TFB-10046 SS5]|uniref:WD40 repeat-like protein n=1 Tax=Auricularia subglabra (strain TFB-10046 / SS5) TaxID=717982 RepID=J0D993_AURST|nr:WD40 repeat-like protein [Auricularia subglabra TFB-10046 SS5]
MAFSPDGTHLISGAVDPPVHIWNTETGLETAHFNCGKGLSALASSPDRMLIAWDNWSGTIRFWRWLAGGKVQECPDQCLVGRGSSGAVFIIAFSPDGNTLASDSGLTTIRIWDISRRQVRRVIRGHTANIRSVAFAPTGNHLASAAEDMTVRIWDAQTGAAIAVLRGHTRPVMSAVFSPDGTRVLSGSWDHTLRVWDRVHVPANEPQPDADA